MAHASFQAAGGIQPEQRWAYRARQVDELVEVSVVRLGTQKPARILVLFVDNAFEGREEWVPPARLKVRWGSVDQYRAREECWDRIHAAGLSPDDPREDAAERVIEMLFDGDEVSIGYRESGAIRIKDPAGLAPRLGLDVKQLTGHPDAFIEDDELIAPWEITELVVTAAARQNPTRVLEYVANEESKAQYEAIHGSWSRGGRRSNDHYYEPDFCIKFDTEYLRPRREILRSWCSADAIDRFDELAELRKEVRRVGDVAQAAIEALRAVGHYSEASRLQRELGMTVEMLWQTDAAD
jgi:hypothetical protein